MFLGYPASHRGYRCLDLSWNKVILSQHVRFDEEIFPFASLQNYMQPTYDFLDNIPLPIKPVTTPNPPHEPNTPQQPPMNDPMPNPLPTQPNQLPTSPPHKPNTPQQAPVQVEPITPILPTTSQAHTHTQTAPNLPNATNTHPMVTHAKADISKPIERLNCYVSTVSPLPRSHLHALHDPQWKQTMLDEYNALITNGTWVLVPRPANVNVVRSMWLSRHKFHADGSLSRYKARLVANGRSQ